MASPPNSSNPFAGPDPFSAASNPFGAASAVETSYTPPNTGTWQRQAVEEEDVPFTSAHLGGAAAATAAPSFFFPLLACNRRRAFAPDLPRQLREDRRRRGAARSSKAHGRETRTFMASLWLLR